MKILALFLVAVILMAAFIDPTAGQRVRPQGSSGRTQWPRSSHPNPRHHSHKHHEYHHHIFRKRDADDFPEYIDENI
jgi:hypothetical protein